MSDLLAQLQAAQTDEEREWLLMKFNLEGLDAPVREAVWGAAIPHWFDADFLAAILDTENTEEFRKVFDKLISLSFVEPFSKRGYNIHERSRKLLLKRLWEDDPARYRELNRRAAHFCTRQDQADTGWRVETIYHLVLVDESQGAPVFQTQGVNWNNTFEYDKLEALIRPMKDEVKAGRLNKDVAVWTYNFQATLDAIYSNFRDSISNLEKALSIPTENMALKVDSIYSLGKAYYMVNEYEAARQRLEEALTLSRQTEDKQGEANASYWLGNVHYVLGEFETSRERLRESLESSKEVEDRVGEANCIYSLGNIHRMLGEYEAAREKLGEALELFRQIGSKLGEANCIYSLGIIHSMLEEHEAGREKLEDSLQLSHQIGDKIGEANSILALGQVHYILNENEAARQKFEESLQIYRQIGNKLGEANCIYSLGDLYYTSGKYEAAREKLEEALKLFRQINSKSGEESSLEQLERLERKLKESE